MKSFKYLYIILFFLLCSCIKEVSSSFDFKSKIVVLSSISTDNETNQFILSNNIPTSEGPDKIEDYYIKDATILLWDDYGNQKQINYSPLFNKSYTVDSIEYKFIEGRKYYIKVTCPDGREATSSMRMPLGITPKLYTCDTTLASYFDTINNSLKKDIDLSLDFERGTDNYQTYAQVYSTYFYETSNNISKSESLMEVIDFPGGSGLLSVKASVSHYVSDTIKSFSISVDSVAFFVKSIDPALQKFKNTVSKQLAAYQDPFAQPILIYSNIDNGLGIFYGSSVRYKTIKFK